MNYKKFWCLMLGHMCFYAGHFVSKVTFWWPWEFAHPYRFYNWLMVKSWNLNPENWGNKRQ